MRNKQFWVLFWPYLALSAFYVVMEMTVGHQVSQAWANASFITDGVFVLTAIGLFVWEARR